VFAIVLGLLAWIYLAAEITLYCAEMNTVVARNLWPRTMVQPPLTEADQRSLAYQATANQRRPEQRVTTSFSTRPMTQDEYRARGYRVDDGAVGIEQAVPEPDVHPTSPRR
jgi:hypothetical protein